MKFRKVIILLVLMSVCISSVQAEDNCLGKLQETYSKLAMESAYGDDGTCLYMNYTLAVVSREPRKVANRSAKAEIYTNSFFTHVSTDGLQMLQDGKDIVVIQPQTKTLFISSAPPKEMQKALFDDFLLMRDSLFGRLDMVSCAVESGANGRRVRVIHCRIKPAFQALCAYRTLSFTVDAADWSLVGVKVGYPPGVPVESVSVVFNTIERRKVPAECVGSVVQKVLLPSGEPTKNYKGYTLLDERKKKQ